MHIYILPNIICYWKCFSLLSLFCVTTITRNSSTMANMTKPVGNDETEEDEAIIYPIFRAMDSVCCPDISYE
jgi:hypothetical protein